MTIAHQVSICAHTWSPILLSSALTASIKGVEYMPGGTKIRGSFPQSMLKLLLQSIMPNHLPFWLIDKDFDADRARPQSAWCYEWHQCCSETEVNLHVKSSSGCMVVNIPSFLELMRHTAAASHEHSRQYIQPDSLTHTAMWHIRPSSNPDSYCQRWIPRSLIDSISAYYWFFAGMLPSRKLRPTKWQWWRRLR